MLNFDNLNAASEFCNQILVSAFTIGGNAIGDLSTDGADPDPNADNSPDERDPTCVPFVATPGIQLVKSGAQDPTVVGDPGITEAGEHRRRYRQRSRRQSGQRSGQPQ